MTKKKTSKKKSEFKVLTPTQVKRLLKKGEAGGKEMREKLRKMQQPNQESIAVSQASRLVIGDVVGELEDAVLDSLEAVGLTVVRRLDGVGVVVRMAPNTMTTHPLGTWAGLGENYSLDHIDDCDVLYLMDRGLWVERCVDEFEIVQLPPELQQRMQQQKLWIDQLAKKASESGLKVYPPFTPVDEVDEALSLGEAYVERKKLDIRLRELAVDQFRSFEEDPAKDEAINQELRDISAHMKQIDVVINGPFLQELENQARQLEMLASSILDNIRALKLNNS